MFHKGGTAVVSSSMGGYFVAVKGEGIYYYSPQGTWKRVFSTEQRILTIMEIGHTLFGAGENGMILRSMDNGETWSKTYFPTKASVWSLTGTNDGCIFAHGKHSIYVSENFGDSWIAFKPFQTLETPPVIRSLCVYGNQIVIGTQIHAQYGGIWLYDLNSGLLSHLKKEENTMISALLILDETYLLVAKGSVKGQKGTVELINLEKIPTYLSYNSLYPEESFLDLAENNGVIYATTSQDEHGYSRIYRVDLNEQLLQLFETTKGHGLRVANHAEEFFVAGLYESKWVQPSHIAANFH
ncbi:WD40/YVTN/BNR-like repeat-containing protein [Metabacillus herbersteinensis]|uniref:WD40/YVTN/BNR-like repeat-containing protein n=1 Tax=Metabacillus herbersteinensis TaxID=283816 RepID=A0ABV6GAL9_9BACI